MNQSIRIHSERGQEQQSAVAFGCNTKKQRLFIPFFVLLSLLLTPLLGWFGEATGGLYAQCNTASPTVLAKWDFNSVTTQCNGAVPTGDGTLTSPFLKRGLNSYCPNINNGCGTALLGTKGFGNTNDFKNAICLAGFWRNDGGIYAAAPGWDINSDTFQPEILANLITTYTLPAGKAGTLTTFSLKVIQKQFDGVNPSFAKQGVGVYRNGVLIYSQTQAITAASVNGSAMNFTFPSTAEFTSDGSAAVKFEIVFGLVHRLLKISTGYDDICIIGTCGGSPSPAAAITPTTCGTSTTNSDGKITISNFGATDHYDISTGSSYTGVQTYATATLIPAGGVITSTLPNPTTPQIYTVRVFSSAGCTTDLQVTLNPTVCSNGSCTAPTATVAATAATCTGTSANNNASIVISGVSGGDKVGISLGTSYNGSLYSSAKALTAGAYSFTALPNPNGSQAYVIRVFNADDNCFKDYPITINETACGCKKIGVQIVSSDQADPDSSPNNNATTEDDYASYEVCKGTQTIDLKLTKTVSPSTGATCPTNTDFVWKMVLTNAGSMSASNIQVTENMPDNLLITATSVTSGTFTISGGWLIPSLAAGASTTLTVTTKASTPGTYSNCAWVSNAFPLNDPNSSPLNTYTANEDDDDCASIVVTGPKTPEVTKEFSPETAKTNTPFRLTIKLTNNESTPITLTAPMVDNLPSSPAQMTVAPTPNLTTSLPGVVATAAGSSITIPTGTVLVPGLNLVQVDVVAPADGEYCNDILAGALQTTSCANVAATQACVIVKSTYVMGPLIKKSFSPEIVGAGQSSTLVITIENRNATGITLLQDFIDQLPSGLVIAGSVTGTCAGVSSFSGTTQVGLLSGSVIAPGTCTISVPVQSASANTYCNTIIMNAMIGTVSNGSVQVMTGNDDIATACLTVSPNPCSTLDVINLSPISATVSPSGTVSLTVNGTGFGTSTLYNWKGTGTVNPQGITTTFTAPATTGTYTLTVVADNRLTGYGTCKDSTTINVLVQASVLCSLTATATASSSSVCQNQAVTLTAQASPAGSYTYTWAAPAGITLTGANTATATATMAVSGLQTFTVTASSSPTCSTTATVSVLVNAPTTLPTYQSTTLCEGGSVNFSISPPAGASAYWTTPANTTINSGTVTIGSVTSSDGGTYTLFYTNENGCTSSTTKVVIVNPKPTLSLANSGCVSGNLSYTVLLSTNASSLTTNAGQLGVTISGNLLTVPVTVTSFVVSATSAAGCVATLPIAAPACTTVCTPPNPGPDQTFCQGITSTTLVSPGAGEQWSVMQLVSGTSPVISNAGGTYSVSGLTLAGVYKFRLASTTVNNCSAVVTVTVNPPTTLPTFTPATICEGQSLSFGASVAVGDAAYWTTPANTTISSGTIAIANATTANSGTYTLYFTNSSGCTSTATQQITINASPTLSLASSGCISDNQSYTVLLNTNASSLTTSAGGLVTISGNLLTVPVTVTSFVVSATSAAGCVATLPITAPVCTTICTPPNAGPDQVFCQGPTTATLVSPGAGEQWAVLQQVSGTAPVIGNVGGAYSVSGLTLPGVYKFVLSSTSISNCSAVVTVTINAKTPINPLTPATVCEGDGLTFSITPAVGASAYWTTPTNTTVNSATVTIASATTANNGVYTLHYTNASGCASDPVSKTVTVNAKPTLSLASSGCVSGNQSYTVLLSTDAASLTTNASQLGVTINGSLITVPASVTSFIVSASSAAGCVTTLPVTAPACTTFCSISAVVSAGSCSTATNTYSATAVVTIQNPTAGGTLTVSTGGQTVTFSTTAATQNTFTATFAGLISDGASHTVIASLPGCGTSTATYTAPASCTVAPLCGLDLVVTPGLCQSATNTYSLSGIISATNVPVSGTLSIVSGAFITHTLAFPTGDASDTFSYSGLISNGQDYTVTASFSNSACAPVSQTFTAPISCSVAPVCSISAVATAGSCATATNTYSATAIVTVLNPVAGGTVTVSTGGQTLSFSTSVVSQNTFTATFNGLISDGLSHTVLVDLPGCGTTSAAYTAPASCSVAPCLDPTLAISPSATICAGQSVSLTASGAGLDASYTFSTTGAVGNSLIVSPTITTMYTVTATTGGGCSTTATAEVTVKTKPNAGIDQTLVCGPLGETPTTALLTPVPVETTGSYSNLLTNPTSASLSAIGLSTMVSSLTAGTYQFVFTASNGCTDTVAVVVPVCQTFCAGLSATAEASSTTITTGQPVTLSATVSPAGSYTYAWSGPGTITPTNTSTVIVTDLPTGVNTFTVTVTSSPGCFTTATVSVTVLTPTLELTVTPGTCQTAMNQYSVSGTISLSASVASMLTITDGTSTATVSVTAGQSSASFSLTGLDSGTGSHTVTVSGVGYSSVSTTYTAPVSCSVTPVCSLSATVTVGICATATNTYSATVIVNLANASAGTLTIDLPGSTPVSQTLAANTGLFTAIFQDLVSDGATYAATISLPGCGSTTSSFTAPISCSIAPVCSISTVATAGLCSTATNTYSSTVVVQLTNPTVGILTITDGPQSATLAVTAGSNATFTVEFPGLVSDGLTHAVTASLPGCSTTTIAYTAPVSCSVAPVCSISAVATAGQCATATNTFSNTVAVTMTNPTAGILTVTDGVNSITFAVAATLGVVTTSAIFNGLVSDGSSHKVTVSLPDCSTTTTTYTAPSSCSITPLASLGDFVWKDNNDNGIQDNNEPGVADVKVELFTVVGGVRSSSALSTTVTDGMGHYTFPNLLLGDYQVRFSQIPTSCTLTSHQNAGATDAADSDADPITGLSQVVHLDPTGTGLAVNNPTIDAGLQRLTYDPTGYIYCYKNNTILKGGKISVTGPGSVTIVLDGSQGDYRFITDGTPGSYTLTYSHPNGYSIATSSWPPSATAVDPTDLDGSALDKDIPANGWVQLGSLPNADTTQLQNGTQAYNPYFLVFTVQAGDPYISNNNLPVDCDQLLGSIGDFVWNDLNKNGQQDSGEPGVDGVTVRLLQQTTPGNFTVVSTTVTAGGGKYLFSDLPAGTYVVEFVTSTLPVNFILTTVTAPGIPNWLDSDANPATGRTGLIELVPTNPIQQDILTIDAGIFSTECPATVKCVPLSIRRIR